MTLIFPQDGDRDTGENFSKWTARQNVTDYVESGMDFSVDWANNTFDLSSGRAYVEQSGGDKLVTVTDTDFTDVQIADGEINHVFLDPDFQQDDAVSLEVNTTNSSPSGPSLKIGELDASNEISIKRNNRPVVEARSALISNLTFDGDSRVKDDVDIKFGDNTDFSIRYDSSDDEFQIEDTGASETLISGSAASGIDFGAFDISVDGSTLWDESASHIPQARLENDAVTINAGDSLTGGGSVLLGESTTIDLGTVENSHLQNSTVTVSSGNGLKGGTSISLGGSTTLQIEPSDFAGAGLSDDGNDALTINTGSNLSVSSDTLNVDQGSGSGLDADLLDGNEYSDLQSEFVDVGGDTMSGTLTVGANIEANSGGNIRQIGTDNTAMFIQSTNNSTGYEWSITQQSGGIGGGNDGLSIRIHDGTSGGNIQFNITAGGSVEVPNGTISSQGTQVALIDRFPLPNNDLQNTEITVAGNSVSLGGSTAIDHIDLSNTNTDDHHAYPVPNSGLTNSSINVSLGNSLYGDSSVSLGGTLNINVDDDFVKTGGDTMNGTLNINNVIDVNSTSSSRIILPVGSNKYAT